MVDMYKKNEGEGPRMRGTLCSLSEMMSTTLAEHGGILGLFTVAIFGPFSAHFRLHFWIIFGCLAEE
jgi:hypothetical protein